jgi:hypothetical protein
MFEQAFVMSDSTCHDGPLENQLLTNQKLMTASWYSYKWIVLDTRTPGTKAKLHLERRVRPWLPMGRHRRQPSDALTRVSLPG